jgi:redox-sensitive bicupin YhaK (pirin superfamily)
MDGIVHTEEISTKVKMRILQLWLTLPKERRWASPKWQELHLDNVPIKKDGNTEIRVYSGTSQGLTAPTQNETPTTIVDFRLDGGYEAVQEIPSSYNGFIYVIEGDVEVGEEQIAVTEKQVAWLDRPAGAGISRVVFRAGPQGSRFILYAGEPQQAPIVSHGPFIGDSKEDIVRLYSEYRQGLMGHVHGLPEGQVLHHV